MNNNKLKKKNEELQGILEEMADPATTPERIAQLTQRVTALNTSNPPKWALVTDRGAPEITEQNFEIYLSYRQISIRWNEMSKEVEINIPNQVFHGDTKLNAQFVWLRQDAGGVGFSVSDQMMNGFVTLIANRNPYHPVREWLDTITWDGVNRLPELYASVELSTPHPMKEVMLRKWTLSAVAALYDQDFSAEGVLTFSGPQGIKKTSWLFGLLPRHLAKTCFKDGVEIDTSNKDKIMEALAFWIIELGELDGIFRKQDMEALKAFVTRKNDIVRPPYMSKANNYPRRTVMYGTVNSEEFLRDTENRRFWVLNVSNLKPGLSDVAQFWAQMKAEYQKLSGKIDTPADREANNEWGWFMSPAERAQMKPLQGANRVANPIEEILDAMVTPDPLGQLQNCTMILRACGVNNPKQPDLNVAGRWFKDRGMIAHKNRQYRVRIAPLPYTRIGGASALDDVATPTAVDTFEARRKRLGGLNSRDDL
jgi:putative DNA primase/helicase